MVDGNNGFHALLTFFAGVLITYFGWSWVNGFISGATDSTTLSICLWASYLLGTALLLLVVPLLIATNQKEEEEASVSIVDGLKGYGAMLLGVMLVRIAWPIGDTITTWATNSGLSTIYIDKLLGLFFLIALVFILYLSPIVFSIFPGVLEPFEEAVKKKVTGG